MTISNIKGAILKAAVFNSFNMILVFIPPIVLQEIFKFMADPTRPFWYFFLGSIYLFIINNNFLVRNSIDHLGMELFWLLGYYFQNYVRLLVLLIVFILLFELDFVLKNLY